MRRIIFAVSNDISFDQRMHRACGSLAKAGWHVTLVGRKRRGSKPLAAFPFRTRRLNCLFERGKMFYAMLNFRLFWFLLFHKADVVCAVDLDTWLACRWASRMKGSTLAYDAHELFTEVPEVVRRPRIQRTWRRIEKKAVTKSDIRYTVSQSVADHFKDIYETSFEVVRNVPRSNPEPEQATGKPAKQGERIVVYQGALNEGRCLENLLRAMPHVEGTLRIAGEGDLSIALRTLADELNLDDKVEFLGWLEPSALRTVTAEATIGFNLLEKDGLSYYYSLSNKFFDFIHAGVPQLCADFPEYRKLNEQFEVGLLTNNSQPEAIVEQLNGILADADRLGKLKTNCLEAAKQFNWELEEQKLLDIYAK